MTVIKLDERRQARTSEIEARLIRLADIEPVLKLNQLVSGWLTKRGLSMLYGPSNAGKTFVALDIAMHIASGTPWRGCRVNGGATLYIAAEGGVGVRNRLAAFKREYPEMASAPLTLLPVGLDLHGQEDALAVCEIIPDAEPALIVVDTLARSMGAGDENTAKDAAAFVRNCDLIREATGAHVMVVHHTGKDEDRGARGSSALRAAVDTEIHVSSEGEIICRKQRDMAIADALHFNLRSVALGADENGDAVTSAVVEAAEAPKPNPKLLSGKNEVAMQALYDALRDHSEERHGGAFPDKGVRAVHVDHWRAACDLHGLTSGTSDSAARTAFMRAKVKLMDLNEIRQHGDHVWRVNYDD